MGKQRATSQRKDKQPMVQPEDEPISLAPWPRPDHTPIEGPGIPAIPEMHQREITNMTAYQTRDHADKWAPYMSICYNGLLRVNMQPTRINDAATLKKMGIFTDVQRMLARIGLGTLASRPYRLYPELVRQFFASVEVFYEAESRPRANEGRIYFFCQGTKYMMTIEELCQIYRFDSSRNRCVLPNHHDYKESDTLWNYIAKPVEASRDQKLSLIRNPVVRIVAKILGNTLFSKEETGSLRIDELFMLHCGLPPFFQELYTTPLEQDYDINIGAVFAYILSQKKFRGLSQKKPKTEYCGSLLTPIFQFHGIDLSTTPCEEDLSFFDEESMKRYGYYDAGTYHYVDRDGRALRCPLPTPLSVLDSLEHLAFLPSEHDQLYARRLRTRRRAPVSRDDAGPSQPSSSRAPHASPDRSPPQPDEYLLPPYTGEYRLQDCDPTSTPDQKLDRIEANQKVIHSMLENIWMALQHIPRPRIPSCFRPSRETAEREEAEEEREREEAEEEREREDGTGRSPPRDTAAAAPATPQDDEDHGDSTEEDTPQLRKRTRRSGI